MQIQVDIGFDELLEVVKKLPQEQLLRFKKELEAKPQKSKREEFRSLLVNGPTMSEEQIKKWKKRATLLTNGGKNNFSRHFCSHRTLPKIR